MKYCTKENINKWTHDTCSSHLIYQAICTMSKTVEGRVELFFNPKHIEAVCYAVLALITPILVQYDCLHLPSIKWENRTLALVFGYLENDMFVELNAPTALAAREMKPNVNLLLAAKLEELHVAQVVFAEELRS